MALNASSYLGRAQHKATGATRPPRYLTDAAEWVDRIYQIERADDTYTADLVLGGADGVSNLPHQALANRTAYLYKQQQKIIETLNQLIEAINAGGFGGETAMKPLVVGKTEPSDGNAAWLQMPSTWSGSSSDVKLTLSDGRTITNPTLDVALSDGRTFKVAPNAANVSIPSEIL